MEVGDKIKVVEITYSGERFIWDGFIIKIEKAFIETSHRRNPITHPQWLGYRNAYSETFTKHYNSKLYNSVLL